jgi:rhamnosyltransferase
MKISVIIPTLNAEKQIAPLLQQLKGQTLPPDEILVVDSQSEDQTAKIAAENGARVIPILRKEFDHGGTRHMALQSCSGDIVLFMTQDAIPADKEYIANLTAPFQNPCVGAAGGRQVAREGARPYEQAVREYSYPAEDRLWSGEDIHRLGVKAFLISDVCSAYRRSAYEKAGGFENPILTNEDMLMAAQLLRSGYSLAYAGRAAVRHSHSYTLGQEYRRNFLIGRFMQRYQERLCNVKETGEGIRLVKYVLKKLLKKGRIWESLCFCMNCAARLLGNRAGRHEEKKQQAKKA